MNIEELIIKGKPQAPSKFLVIGDPFSGKTTLAAKAPKPLFISTDGNAAKAGLDAVNADNLDIVRQAMKYFSESDKYSTLVIDTVEGIADLIEKSVIANHNAQYEDNPKFQVQSLNEVAYGKLIGIFNKRLGAFSESLLGINKNVIILTYMKRQIDDATQTIQLTSELKGIRNFTKFCDGMIMTSYDGDKHEARLIEKREVMAGEVDYGEIEDFLTAAGWGLSKKKTKIGSAKK